jgi:hypothetical protein
MANAFDEFDTSAKVEADPFAEFDHSSEEYAPPKKTSVIGKAGKLMGGAAKGIVETGLGMATGTLASALGGVGGLVRTAGGLVSGESFDEAASKGADVVRGTQQALTYAPRSREGELMGRVVAAPFELASSVTGHIGGTVGREYAGEKGRIAGEAIGEVVPEMALAAAPLKGAVKAMKEPIKELPPTTPKEHQAKKAQDLGYVLPPSEANPGLLNRFITGWGGKKQTEQAASIKNQPVTNRLAKRALGVAEDKTLSVDLLDNVRANAGKAYRAIKESEVPIQSNPKFVKAIDDLSQDWSIAERDYPELAKSKSAINDLKSMLKKESVSPTGAIEMVKDLRASAKDNFRAFNDPSKVALARAQRTAADALDTLVEDNLTIAGKPELVGEYKKARELIAKSYDVEAAMNDATGNVNAVYLGKLLKKRPLTGELKDIARFARTFEKSARTPEAIGTYPGISPLDVAVAGMEAVPALAAGRPGLAAGAISAAVGRPLARTMGLSERYQTKGGGKATRYDLAQRRKQALRRGAPAAAVGAVEGEEAAKQRAMEEAF